MERMGHGIIDRFVSTVRRDPDTRGESTAGAADTPDANATRLYECPDCGTVYVATELETCSDCGTRVDRIPSERDLGLVPD